MFIQKGKIRFSQKEVGIWIPISQNIFIGLVQFKQSKRHGTPSPFLTESTAEHLLGTATAETMHSMGRHFRSKDLCIFIPTRL